MIRSIRLRDASEIPFDTANSTDGSSQNLASPSGEKTCICWRGSSREKKKKRNGPSRNTVGLTQKDYYNPTTPTTNRPHQAPRFRKIFLASGSLTSVCRGIVSTRPVRGLIQMECDRPSHFRKKPFLRGRRSSSERFIRPKLSPVQLQLPNHEAHPPIYPRE